MKPPIRPDLRNEDYREDKMSGPGGAGGIRVTPGDSTGCGCAYGDADPGASSFGWLWLAVAAFAAARRRRPARPSP
jgi:MYXO-CTERM domain-containing protein